MSLGAPFSDPHTSRDAAEQILPHADTLRMKVLRLVSWDSEGLTAEQVEARSGLGGNTVRPRLVELVARGFIYKSLQKRQLASGRNGAVYFVTEAGRKAAGHK